MAHQIVEDRSGKTGYRPRGGALALWKCRDHEVMLSGPAETGKTRACLEKLDALLWKYPGAQAVMVRKVRDTIHSSCLQTYKKVLGKDSPVQPYGGEKAEWFDYPNGSRLWLAGMDRPGKALSSERDFVYVNQCEELELNDWETLLTRVTGRAGNSPYPQALADCNPGPPHHWIKNRPTLNVIESRHEDNPVLWDASAGQWTEQGKRTLAVLDSLTGVRKERLRHGRWVSAEGAVYEFDTRLHLVEPFFIPPHWTRGRCFDFGYTNPFVCLWFALDEDGRIFIYRQLYHTKRTVRVHARRVNELSHGESYVVSIADHDAEDRATLLEEGIATIPADKTVTVGIQRVQERLKLAGDGKPRLFVFRNCLVERDEDLAAARAPVCVEQEFDVYAWPKGADGKPVKEEPVKVHDHAMDCVRYIAMWAEGLGGALPDLPIYSPPGGSIIDQMPPDTWL